MVDFYQNDVMLDIDSILDSGPEINASMYYMY